jgi:predicted nucleic acid-binding protein
MRDEIVFMDTNLIVYLYSKNDTEKQKQVINLLSNYDCFVSTQVLNEFCNVAIKKQGKQILEIDKNIDEILDTCNLLAVRHSTIKKSLVLNGRYGYSYYDCLIIASALEADCKYLFTEDMQDGQIVENTLKIVNPFV